MARFGTLLLLVGPMLVLARVRQPLPVLFMVPVGSDGENLTAGLLPAVSLALQDLLILGGACPSVTSLIARALPSLGLLQVSFEAPTPSLSNRKWYRHLFSTAPPVRAVNLATVKLLQRYRWRRVGLLTQDQPGLTEMTRDLTRQLLRADVQLAAAERFSGDACGGLRRLQDEDVRIIVGHFEDGSVTDVFCCVSEQVQGPGSGGPDDPRTRL